MIAKNEYSFSHVDSWFKDDKRFILDAIKRNAAVYGLISNELKRDVDVVKIKHIIKSKMLMLSSTS